MEKETVSLLLLLKPMTKTSQLNNNIAIMIYQGGCPVLKYQFLFFLPLFWWKSHERHVNEKKKSYYYWNKWQK